MFASVFLICKIFVFWCNYMLSNWCMRFHYLQEFSAFARVVLIWLVVSQPLYLTQSLSPSLFLSGSDGIQGTMYEPGTSLIKIIHRRWVGEVTRFALYNNIQYHASSARLLLTVISDGDQCRCHKVHNTIRRHAIWPHYAPLHPSFVCLPSHPEWRYASQNENILLGIVRTCVK